MITYKFTIVYDDYSTEVIRDVPQASIFSSVISVYSAKRSKNLIRDGHDVIRIMIVPEIHPIIREKIKSLKEQKQ